MAYWDPATEKVVDVTKDKSGIVGIVVLCLAIYFLYAIVTGG